MRFEVGPSSNHQANQSEKGYETGPISQKGIKELDTVATEFQKRAAAQRAAAIDFYNESHRDTPPITVNDLDGMSPLKRDNVIRTYLNAGQAEVFAETYDAVSEEGEPLSGEPAPDLGETIKRVLPNPSDTIH